MTLDQAKYLYKDREHINIVSIEVFGLKALQTSGSSPAGLTNYKITISEKDRIIIDTAKDLDVTPSCFLKGFLKPLQDILVRVHDFDKKKSDEAEYKEYLRLKEKFGE